MPSTMPGRELVQNFLKDNDIKITDLAKMYKLSNQDARDYVSGRKTNPAAVATSCKFEKWRCLANSLILSKIIM